MEKDAAERSKKIGERLAIMRKDAKCTQAQLAERMANAGYGWTAMTVYNIERGNRALKLDEAVGVIKCLDLPDELISTLAEGDVLQGTVAYPLSPFIKEDVFADDQFKREVELLERICWNLAALLRRETDGDEEAFKKRGIKILYRAKKALSEGQPLLAGQNEYSEFYKYGTGILSKRKYPILLLDELRMALRGFLFYGSDNDGKAEDDR